MGDPHRRRSGIHIFKTLKSGDHHGRRGYPIGDQNHPIKKYSRDEFQRYGHLQEGAYQGPGETPGG